MMSWLHLTLISAVAVLILVLIFFQIFQQFLHPKTHGSIASLQNGIGRFDEVCDHARDSSPHHEPLMIFSWGDHPSLVADAVQNGWPGFCFTASTSSFPSDVDTSWEVCEGSAEYIQKIIVKKGIERRGISVIRTALPLPGPRFGVSYFPQDAYFEIIILAACNEDLSNVMNEVVSGSSSLSDSKNNLECSERIDMVNEEEEEEGESESEKSVLVWIGLMGGSQTDVAFKTHPPCIAFNSNASIHLNGTKIICESENHKWLKAGNVIGCGYNPSRKKVIFTLNSKLVHEIDCKTEEFGHPLYPTIAANTHIMFLLNLGQIPFQYEPGNLLRTSNPCYIGPHVDDSAAAIGHIDSMELFSMGRIDSNWQQWSGNSNTSTGSRAFEFDRESETDLFEIRLT